MPSQVLINPDSGSAEQFDPQSAQQALQNGYHVPLVDPEGNAVSAPFDQAQNLVQSGGHSQPSPAQLQDLLNTSKYSTPGQHAKAFIEGALESLSGGLSGAAETNFGIAAPQEQLNRKQYLPATHAAGEIAGIVGGGELLPEASVPGLIAKGSKAAAAGIEATGAFGRAAQMATQAALEAGAFSAEHQINERLLGDPNATAEHMLSHIGLSAALGGGFGLALSPISEFIGNALNKQASKLAEAGEETAAKSQMPPITQALDNPGGEFFKIRNSATEEPASLTDIADAPLITGYTQPTDPAQAKSFLEKAGKALKLVAWFKDPQTMAISQAASLAKKALGKILESSPEDGPLFNALVGANQIAARTNQTITKYAAGIFGSQASKALETNEEVSQKASEPQPMNKMAGTIMAHATNPEGLINHLQESLSPIQPYLPNTVTAMNATIGRAVAFLSSKVPPEQKQAPLDAPSTPSNFDVHQFNRYASLVEDPVSILKHVKDGTIAPHDMEAVSTVFPMLYDKMKSAVTNKMMEQLSKNKNNEIPYKTRLGLSMFLGQNLDSTTSPNGIQFNQMALTNNRMQQQVQAAKQTRPSKTGMSKMKTPILDETAAQQSAQRRARSI